MNNDFAELLSYVMLPLQYYIGGLFKLTFW